MSADESLTGLLQRAALTAARLEREARETARLAEQNDKLCDEVFVLRQRISALESELAHVKGKAA